MLGALPTLKQGTTNPLRGRQGRSDTASSTGTLRQRRGLSSMDAALVTSNRLQDGVASGGAARDVLRRVRQRFAPRGNVRSSQVARRTHHVKRTARSQVLSNPASDLEHLARHVGQAQLRSTEREAPLRSTSGVPPAAVRSASLPLDGGETSLGDGTAAEGKAMGPSRRRG